LNTQDKQKFKVFITDYGFSNIDCEMKILTAAGAEVIALQCKTADDVIVGASDADALLVQWAPITADVVSRLHKCKVIVRYGIGVDNIDLGAAIGSRIPVCNVPDYCIDEVADHTMALALCLVRRLQFVDRRLRDGIWSLILDSGMSVCREMTFACAGYGKIARAVLQRARAFKFRLAAYDPYVSSSEMEADGVVPMSLDGLFAEADVLSLHSPLTSETRHMVSAARLRCMKTSAILVNTARGELVDTHALALALRQDIIAQAGLDVFETEPLPRDHPLLSCENVLLTSHVAWYSKASIRNLQQLAAFEVVRALRGEPLKSRVG
jgi:D-3-phosphoglycerate dehydrogenase